MAHLWAQTAAGKWEVRRLEDDFLTLAYDKVAARRDLMRHELPRRDDLSVGLCRAKGTDREVWLLMAGSKADVRINGVAMPGGLRLLSDRDEIRIGQERFFFSTETLAAAVEFPGASRPVICQRCKDSIVEGTPAVRCPQCGVWHHQTDRLPCWSYADTCASCSQVTDFEAGYRWTPEDL